ncbi:hypothetical protein [Bosea sp. PAMC 26642]|uniref:hypothetical protein n=1 Tax=Bosea sp. (strain PAMC 26642) TaxID=1792307 RepID=UPI00077008C5|nr:hypothetical protein [Bosea sp. PAMC 26642]AMJ62653.1 hypothetical protein AXW83_22250 [Bosea sp. PAMC 26642]
MSAELHEGALAQPDLPGLPMIPVPGPVAALDGELESDVPTGAGRAMWSVLDHLEQALDHETSHLMALKSADFNRLNETKSRLLLDASRAARAMRNEVADGRLVARLSTLRLKLEHNRLVIGMHLDAVREIAAAMTSTLIDAESDGTYHAWPGAQIAGGAAGKVRTT